MGRRVAKNFTVTFEDFEKEMIDDFFESRPLVRSAVIRKLLVDWVNEQIKKEGG